KPAIDTPISVQLMEVRDGGFDNQSMGLGKGPGGPRTLPKLNVPVPPAQRTGKLDSGSVESSAPSEQIEEATPPPKPVALPGLKGIPNADYDQYLKQIERRVRSVWKYPDEVTGAHKVTVRFTLDRAGKLTQAEVLESSDSRLNAGAVEAMKRASPFPPIPETLKDLANEPMIMRFAVS